jgi:DNA polymerase III subunit epsilon
MSGVLKLRRPPNVIVEVDALDQISAQAIQSCRVASHTRGRSRANSPFCPLSGPAIDLTLAAMAEALAKSGDYRILRRLVPRKTINPCVGHSTKAGILLDVETTGLDQRTNEVVELGMVKFDYLPDSPIAGIKDVFSSFSEPSEPIPLEVTALTGITNEMVAGQRIDEAAVSSFVDDSVIVIAHNASFDRKFAERHWSIFQRKAWGCSATEVE